MDKFTEILSKISIGIVIGFLLFVGITSIKKNSKVINKEPSIVEYEVQCPDGNFVHYTAVNMLPPADVCKYAMEKSND